MPTVSAILDAIAPELADAPGKAIHIELAEQRVGTVFAERRNHAVALLAAHTLTMSERAGSSGMATSIKEGQLAEGYTATAGAGTRLDATSYGAEYQQLKRESIFPARTVLV